jgi:hypothetical protein
VLYKSLQKITLSLHDRYTGLGVWKLIKPEQGAPVARLSVNGEVNRGSAFTLHLPVADEDRMQLPAVSPLVRRWQHEREYSAN